MSNIFSQFKTDQNLEQEGVLIDYQDFRLRLRRSGGSNRLYTKSLEKAMKPWRHKDIDKEPVEVRIALWLSIFMEACYVDGSWETKVDGQFVRGIHNEAGEIVPASTKNVHDVLTLLPDLSRGLQAEAADLDHYLAAQTEAATADLKA